AAPKLAYEVLVVDNNPFARLPSTFETEFPDVRFLKSDRHRGFGGGQNFAFAQARGRHVLVFNPDIFASYGNLEALVAYLDAHPDVGIVGAQLRNPDGSLQDSCYRFDRPFVKVLRRTPFRHLPLIARLIRHHLMQDHPRDVVMDVDWLMGACLMVRRELYERLGGFDEGFVMYFEDTDLCRRAWESGARVVYHPEVVMVHYHRREGAHGNLFSQLFIRANRLHLASWVRYTKKYARVSHPRRSNV
ncbi:MAG: Glycosyl transferase family 2, partial [Candidatus Giovannonibacteria bacterium GW2011_GWA2_53_7]